MRQIIRNERARELAGEGTRWFDILRWGLMDTQAGIDELKSRDIDFTNFKLGVSKLLPIPQRDPGTDRGCPDAGFVSGAGAAGSWSAGSAHHRTLAGHFSVVHPIFFPLPPVL